MSVQFLGADAANWFATLLLTLSWIFGFALIAGAIYGVYFLISLPLRRQERARFFLDLLETGIKQGTSPEQTIRAVSATRERDVGVRFHLLAAHLENGVRWETALERVPHLLPAPVMATLKVGAETGDLLRVLPACRQLLGDGVGQVRKAHHYLLLLLFGITPFWIFVLHVLTTYVFPKFEVLWADLGGGSAMPELISLLWMQRAVWIGGYAVLLGLLYLGVIAYVGGPRLSGWLQAGLTPRVDYWLYWLPWRRKRMHRDFSNMLGILLDGGLPEEKAIALAAECTANSIFQRRALNVIEELRRGAKLPEAMRHLDAAGEFRWRLENACHCPSGFRAALSGWQEALHLKAFQQEQIFAQTVTTGLVLLNGALVAVIAISVFQMLTGLMWEGLLW